MANYETEAKLLISGDATGAETAVTSTVTELEKLRRETEKPLAQIAAVEQLREGLDSLSTGIIKSTAQMDKERAKLAQLEAELRAAGVDTKNLAAEKTRLEQKSIGAARHISSLKDKLADMREAAKSAARSTKEAGDAAGQAGKNAQAGAIGMGQLVAGFKLLSTLAIAREFIQANASIESLTLALENVTGSSQAAAEEMAFVRGEATRLGIELTSAAGSYTQLAASAKGTSLEGKATREIWSSVAEIMARLGKSTADTDGALLAIGQIMSKGVVSAEELRGQLGERLPGAFQAAARAVGTTTQGLGEMLQRGELLAEDFLPKFAAELRKLGDGEIDNFNANLNKSKNVLREIELAAGDTGLFEGLSQGLKVGAVAAFTAWEGFELLGKTLANMAYTVATLDFSGYRKRQKEALDEARKDVGRVLERLYPLEQTIKQTGDAAERTGEQMQAAFGGQTEASVENLGKAFKEIGLDLDEVRTGISSTERKVIESFSLIARDKNVNGEALVSAYLSALDKVREKAAPQLTQALDAAFRNGKVSVDLFNAALEETVTKTDYFYQNQVKGADAAEKANEKFLSNMEKIQQRITDLRARANERQVDDSIEGQALATLDLLAAEEKLRRLRAQSNDPAEIAKQAEAVRNVASGIEDQARAHEAVRNSYELEAQALERIQAQAKAASGTEAGKNILSDTALSDLDKALQKLAEIDQKRVEVVIVPVLERGDGSRTAFSQSAFMEEIDTLARKRGGR